MLLPGSRLGFVNPYLMTVEPRHDARPGQAEPGAVIELSEGQSVVGQSVMCGVSISPPENRDLNSQDHQRG